MITAKRYSQNKTRKTLKKKSLDDFEYVLSNNITDNIHCLAFNVSGKNNLEQIASFSSSSSALGLPELGLTANKEEEINCPQSEFCKGLVSIDMISIVRGLFLWFEPHYIPFKNEFLSLFRVYSQLQILILLAQGKMINGSDTIAILDKLVYLFTIETIGLMFTDLTSSFGVG